MNKFYLMKFLFLLFPIIIFSQAKKDSIYENYIYSKAKCIEENKKDKILYDKLKHEASEMDFNSLTRTLIDDLDERQFTRRYINFRYSVFRLECGSFDPGEYECEKYNLKDPFYNLQNWTTDDLIYLGKKFKDKFIIPSSVGSGLGYYEGYYYVDKEDAEKFKKFSVGKVKETGAEFYYYSKNSKDSLEISVNTGMDYIQFSFYNLPDYQVKVYQYINSKKTVKTYEYKYDKWEIID
ncbi:hypothetical protein DRF68_15560 [Candidatus Chryseobacterium massiliae]|uniref:Uncharacterized protein n=2 Tax=Chryseobacterium group TaxID=2782232 RepID=A0A3D9AW29_9FLAO|nr:hypothetical protein DRF68_15560 [Candidatus Chryseobacterium massiliae]